MLTEVLPDNILKIKVSEKLKESDFTALAPQTDAMIREYGHIRLLIDATAFNGWSDMEAARKHFAFVRDHQKKIERVALIAGHAWQHWIAGMASVFVHPDIKVFDNGRQAEAEEWLRR